MDLENPYRSPEEFDDEKSAGNQFTRRVPWWILRTWPFIFAANLIVPSLLATSILGYDSYVGVIVACLVFLVAGWWILNTFSWFASSFLAGCCVIAATQLLPILQIIAGVVSLGIAVRIGLAESPVNDHFSDRITSIAGGFVVTFLVGSILMTMSVGTGYMIHLVSNAIRRK